MTMIGIPETAAAGDIVPVKLLLSHPMETGFRADFSGKRIPRDIITEVRCLYRNELVFRAEFFPAVSANPFLSFTFKATESGPVTFVWTDMKGQEFHEIRHITVT